MKREHEVDVLIEKTVVGLHSNLVSVLKGINVGRLLDLIQATLKKDGIALITTPNIESLRARLRALVNGKIPSFDDKSDPTHLMPILHETLGKMLARRQMQIIKVQQYPVNRNQSFQYGSSVRFLARILRMFFSDKLYGDNTVYLISHIK